MILEARQNIGSFTAKGAKDAEKTNVSADFSDERKIKASTNDNIPLRP
jgi:hypothetical protein